MHYKPCTTSHNDFLNRYITLDITLNIILKHCYLDTEQVAHLSIDIRFQVLHENHSGTTTVPQKSVGEIVKHRS